MAKETWLWLASGLGYGAPNTGDLLAAYPGGAEEIAADLGGSKADELLTQKQAERLASTRPSDFSLTLARAETMGIAAIPFDDPDYPDMLRSIHNPPPVLFIKGDLSLMNGQLTVAMVGARKPSAYGVEAMKAVGRGIAMGGAIIVSGLADGLDAEAHKAALAVNGPTIACIGFGHDTCYPASNKKLKEVIESYGAVISEYPLGTKPEKPYFLQRNRLIAGISHALVVGEARRYSGTMSTVNFATDYGRDVFAIPGSIFSELSGGTNAMIREGAFLAGSATDVLNLYGIELPGEDPVVAAAKQAEEGRPAAAPAQPPAWKQSVSRPEPRNDEPAPSRTDRASRARAIEAAIRENPPPGSGRRREAPQAAADARVGSVQAISAFRQIQDDMPPTDDAEVDARNRMLDDRINAVNDSVEIGRRAAARPAEGKDPDKQVKTFDWNKVEHIDSSQIDLMKARQEEALSRKQKKPASGRRQKEITSLSPISRVGAVEAVTSVMPVAAVEMVAPPLPAEEEVEFRPDPVVSRVVPEKRPAPAEQPPREVPPPSAPPRRTRQKEEESLSGKLRTLQPTEKPAQEKPPLTGIEFEETKTVEDLRLKGLGDKARKAYKQLGATPVTLKQITEGSGLNSGEAMAALTELELVGLSRQLAGRRFVIMQ